MISSTSTVFQGLPLTTFEGIGWLGAWPASVYNQGMTCNVARRVLSDPTKSPSHHHGIGIEPSVGMTPSLQVPVDTFDSAPDPAIMVEEPSHDDQMDRVRTNAPLQTRAVWTPAVRFVVM